MEKLVIYYRESFFDKEKRHVDKTQLKERNLKESQMRTIKNYPFTNVEIELFKEVERSQRGTIREKLVEALKLMQEKEINKILILTLLYFDTPKVFLKDFLDSKIEIVIGDVPEQYQTIKNLESDITKIQNYYRVYYAKQRFNSSIKIKRKKVNTLNIKKAINKRAIKTTRNAYKIYKIIEEKFPMFSRDNVNLTKIANFLNDTSVETPTQYKHTTRKYWTPTMVSRVIMKYKFIIKNKLPNYVTNTIF